MGAARNRVIFGFGALGLCACPGTIDNVEPFLAARRPDAGTLVCPDVVAEFFSNPQNCSAANCHASSAFQAGLDLESPNLVARLEAASATPSCGGGRVLEPGQPEASLLYTKLLPDPACGSTMPLRRTLPAGGVECVRRWIVGLVDPPPDGGVLEPDAGRPVDAGPGLPDGGTPDTGTGLPDGGTVDAGTSMIEIVQAESAQVIEPPLEILADPEALDGSYVVVPPVNVPINQDPAATGVGRLALTFEVPHAGTYRIWMRSRAPSVASDSFFMRIDQGPWVKWNDINLDFPMVWHWDGVRDSDAGPGLLEFPLQSGQHVFEINRREPGLQMDAFIITDDLSYDPLLPG